MLKRLCITLVFLLWATPARAQLALSDFTPPAGHSTVVAAVLIAAGGNQLCTANDCTASIVEGSLTIAPDLTINRDIRLQNDDQNIAFRRLGTVNGQAQGAFTAYFARLSGMYSDSRVFVQTAGGVTEFPNFGGVGSGFYRHEGATNTAAVSGITAGDRVIVAITSAAAVAADN